MLQRPATLTEHAISTIRSIRSGGGWKKFTCALLIYRY